jgi:hypothetical protein
MPMSLRSHIRRYLWSFVYAAAILFIPVHGPRQLSAALLQLAIGASLLMLLFLLLGYRNEIREVVLGIFRACAQALLCLLPAGEPDWLLASGPASAINPFFRSVSFQRPPPRVS